MAKATQTAHLEHHLLPCMPLAFPMNIWHIYNYPPHPKTVMCFWRHNIYIRAGLWMQLKHGPSPQPEIPPSWGLMSSTSVVLDTLWLSNRGEFRDWSPSFIHKAVAWGSQGANNLDTRSTAPSLITGPLTQYLHWGDNTIKTASSPHWGVLTPVIYTKMGSSAV